MAWTICRNCIRQFDASCSICPHCGWDSKAPIQGFAPSIVIKGTDPTSGDDVIRVDDPSGVRSEVRLSREGLSLSVSEAMGIGRPGEARVTDTLKDLLVRDGHQVAILDGDDAEGIDRVLEVDGQRFALQITVSPQDPNFWRQANVSKATIQVPIAEAVTWIRDAIQKKRNAPNIKTLPLVLAVDIRHAGLVATIDFVRKYLALYESPITEFGFASVWLVGPTVDYCCRLGDGQP